MSGLVIFQIVAGLPNVFLKFMFLLLQRKINASRSTSKSWCPLLSVGKTGNFFTLGTFSSWELFHLGNFFMLWTFSSWELFHVGNFFMLGTFSSWQRFHLGNFFILGTFSSWKLFHVGNFFMLATFSCCNFFDNYDLLYESAFPRSLINQHGVKNSFFKIGLCCGWKDQFSRKLVDFVSNPMLFHPL